jgi:hypothetical protein
MLMPRRWRRCPGEPLAVRKPRRAGGGHSGTAPNPPQRGQARTQTINQLRVLVVTGPTELRQQLRDLTVGTLIDTCARMRSTGDLADPIQAAKAALRRLARRHQQLSEEIRDSTLSSRRW